MFVRLKSDLLINLNRVCAIRAVTKDELRADGFIDSIVDSATHIVFFAGEGLPEPLTREEYDELALFVACERVEEMRNELHVLYGNPSARKPRGVLK